VSKPAVLYISYDGMLEPLGQSQVLSYLEGLSKNYSIILMSFEKESDWNDSAKRQAIEARARAGNIHWVPLRYHKSPSVPATLFDISHGTARGIQLALKHHVKIIHARSYVSALMALGIKKACGAKFLFDMRGLWPDERVDGGLWKKEGRLYQTVKKLERQYFLNADHTVTLTHASAELISNFDYLKENKFPITVIPTCADLERFRPVKSNSKDFVLGYLGSVGTWYLFDEVLECFKLIREKKPNAKLLIVNRNEQEYVKGRLNAFGFDSSCYEITAADHKDVPQMVSRMTVGSAIIKPSYSKIASAPTKLAEYLGCGIPCLGNDRVGDMHSILEGERTGVSLTGFTPQERSAAVDRLFLLLEDTALATRCRSVAERLFSLEQGVVAYNRIYASLLA
jgi:glycosyltransferase involved in cell wall biosynthesis